MVRMRSAVRICLAAPKGLENFGFRGFFVAIFDFSVWVKLWVSWLTHTVTHVGTSSISLVSPLRAKLAHFTVPPFPMRPACAGLAWEYVSAPDRFSCPVRFFSALHHLRHKAVHHLSGLILLLPCGVGIGAESESGVVVAQHGGHRLDIHTVLKGCGGKGVP